MAYFFCMGFASDPRNTALRSGFSSWEGNEMTRLQLRCFVIGGGMSLVLSLQAALVLLLV
ncbi:hypothetical protein SAMN02745129_3022 [Ferrimonas marina]|uniref:Uncharacterized protein n=1 Tax=Ferrimonas marina TaxID=299255 RepID=A0A1M5VW21_9GAMM|nr:hypothetical protein SAMN02745129_3022 [Ferrimonas marina]